MLVRVHAAGLHIGDVFGVRGSPFPVRFTSGLRGPKLGVPGFDIAGTVEAIGSAVTRFAPGDEVFGRLRLAVVRAPAPSTPGPGEDGIIAKPPDWSFEQAAAIPTSASAALHGLRDAGRLQAGQRVLINGASGGVGTYAVQIARAFGAEVTGVCGPTNVELVRSLGAHHVIDYTREDFTRGTARYDLILDNMENHSLAACRRALAPDGTLVLMSGTGASGLGLLVRLIRPVLLSPFVKHNLRRPLSTPKRADLEVARGDGRGGDPPAGHRRDVSDGRGGGCPPPHRDRARTRKGGRRMADVRVVLAGLWVAVMLTYLLGDVLRLMAGDVTPGEIEGRTAGQGMWLGIAVIMLVPIVMVVLSLVLPSPAIGWVSIVVAVLVVVFNLVGLPYKGLYDNFLIIVSFVFNALIAWYAWTWVSAAA